MDRKRAREQYALVAEKMDEQTLERVIPDVYGNKKRAIRNFVQQYQDQDEDDDNAFPIISDTVAAAQLLIENLAIPLSAKGSDAAKKIPPVCFVHQIYSVLKDNTAVDRELQQAVKEGSWRKFHIVGALEDEFVVMRMDNYLAMIDEAKEEFISDQSNNVSKDAQELDANLFGRFKQFVQDKRYTEVAVTRKALMQEEFKFTERELIQLVNHGLLLPHLQLGSYWFSIRKQGFFMSHYTKGRIEMLRMIKKRATKDMLEKHLKSRKLKNTIFGHDFLIHDLVGSGRAERYTRKGES
ncbi:serine-threonine protein kinase 19-domain-containing protein [Radiomyces spectabilis]|uniref:serine-threonine protein kinase 19-domain-containing protein n=1 Tax=Radiomyces spectabilis TaxID=64574 RepID=UPI00222033BD|nr:serine-threonine protein kinase 19-domain-containing protein [Radiomyces spectabilis]KAI8376140.1 serine-threonine protein kinase 19-domain-containing protein [Radiomyces spectabilis]